MTIIDNPELQAWLEGQGIEVLKNLGIRPGDSVLDFGCGPGRYALPLLQAVAPAGMVVAIDRNSDAVRKLRENAETLHPRPNLETFEGDGQETLATIPSDTFDAAMLFDVLQHVRDWPGLLGELRRVLKPAARLYVYPTLAVHPGKVDIEKLTSCLETAGFVHDKTRRVRLFHRNHRVEDDVFLFRLPAEEKDHV